MKTSSRRNCPIVYVQTAVCKLVKPWIPHLAISMRRTGRRSPSFSKLSGTKRGFKKVRKFLPVNFLRRSTDTTAGVHSLTAMCWTKCITGKIGSGTLDKSESSCLDNCVNRYIDTQKTVIRQLEQASGRG